MDYKCLLDKSYEKVVSTFPTVIYLFGVDAATS